MRLNKSTGCRFGNAEAGTGTIDLPTIHSYYTYISVKSVFIFVLGPIRSPSLLTEPAPLLYTTCFFALNFHSFGRHYLPFCIIWALEKPDSSTKPSEQYTIGYPDTWAFPSTKFESETTKRDMVRGKNIENIVRTINDAQKASEREIWMTVKLVLNAYWNAVCYHNNANKLQ